MFQLLYNGHIEQLCAHHQEKLPYLSDNEIFHSVWAALWFAGWDESSHPNQQNRHPPIESEKYQCRIDTVVLLMMGT